MTSVQLPRELDREFGYCVRIKTEKSLKQTLDTGRYYTGLRRNWHRETKILFLMKTEKGDAIIGYGAPWGIDFEFQPVNALEGNYYDENNFYCCIVFRSIIKFTDPLLIKESALNTDKRKGMLWHGAKLHWEMVDALLDQAEEKNQG